jgi:hypothetical protein
MANQRALVEAIRQQNDLLSERIAFLEGGTEQRIATRLLATSDDLVPYRLPYTRMQMRWISDTNVSGHLSDETHSPPNGRVWRPISAEFFISTNGDAGMSRIYMAMKAIGGVNSTVALSARPRWFSSDTVEGSYYTGMEITTGLGLTYQRNNHGSIVETSYPMVDMICPCDYAISLVMPSALSATFSYLIVIEEYWNEQ